MIRLLARPLWSTCLSLAAAVGISDWLTLALIPDAVPMETAVFPWQRGVIAASWLLLLGLLTFTLIHLLPLPKAPDLVPSHRELAHDFPFKITRLCFIGALGMGMGSAFFLLLAKVALIPALVVGVFTYLLFVLPVLGVYLVTRQVLRPHAAGAWAGERPTPMPGERQSVASRVVFALQVPLMVCAAGIVLVEQVNGNRYAKDLEDYYRERYDTLLGRALASLPDEPTRLRLAQQLNPPPGVLIAPSQAGVRHMPVPMDASQARPISLRVLPFALLVGVAGLAVFLGRWLAREVTRELKAVRQTLSALRGGQAAPVEGGRSVTLKETAYLIDALDSTLAGFAARSAAMAQAALTCRQAEHAKARFLAHLSHELKSPLNSILGFTEVMLAELDGPLTPRQRARLGIIWRSGDALLRFILALLDLARLDQRPEERDLPQKAVSTTELHALLKREERADPLGAVSLRFELCQPEGASLMDAPSTAQALLLTAGLLLDRMDQGVVNLTLSRSEDGGVEVMVWVSAAELEASTERSLAWLSSPADTWLTQDAQSAPLVLLRLVTLKQGGTLEVSPSEPWPAFKVTFPRA